jgi:hypothetical protein
MILSIDNLNPEQLLPINAGNNPFVGEWVLRPTLVTHRSLFGASARISKGLRYQRFLRKREGSSFGQKRAICVVQGKT